MPLWLPRLLLPTNTRTFATVSLQGLRTRKHLFRAATDHAVRGSEDEAGLAAEQGGPTARPVPCLVQHGGLQGGITWCVLSCLTCHGSSDWLASAPPRILPRPGRPRLPQSGALASRECGAGGAGGGMYRGNSCRLQAPALPHSSSGSSSSLANIPGLVVEHN